MDVNKTYRLSGETVEGIAGAAKQYGVSQRYVIESAFEEWLQRCQQSDEAQGLTTEDVELILDTKAESKRLSPAPATERDAWKGAYDRMRENK